MAKKKKKENIEEILLKGDHWYDGFWILMYKRPWVPCLIFLMIVASIILLAKNGVNITDIFK